MPESTGRRLPTIEILLAALLALASIGEPSLAFRMVTGPGPLASRGLPFADETEEKVETAAGAVSTWRCAGTDRPGVRRSAGPTETRVSLPSRPRRPARRPAAAPCVFPLRC